MRRYSKYLVVLIGVFVVGQILVVWNDSIQKGRIMERSVGHLQDRNNISRSVFKNAKYIRGDVGGPKMKTLVSHTAYPVFEKQYDNFNITSPFFVDEKSRVLFHRRQTNVDALGSQPKNKLHGEIFEVRRGTVDVRLDCGYRSDRNWVHPNRTVTKEHWFPALVPAVVKEAQTVQHFIDGALPKVIQALPLLQNSSVKLLIEKVRDTIVLEMVRKLNISEDQLVFYRPKKKPKGDISEHVYGADRLIYPCITPPLHPVLWQEARARIGVPPRLQVPLKDGYIIFVTRKGCYNCGRTVFNKPRVFKMLTQRYGEEKVKIFNGPISLEDNIQLFGGARIIMGPHGGGMYNINFAPSKTVVIEFMATFDNGDMVAASDQIIWTMAQMLDQEYWRLSLRPLGKKGHMDVDIGKLEQILNVVDTRIKH